MLEFLLAILFILLIICGCFIVYFLFKIIDNKKCNSCDSIHSLFQEHLNKYK